uniref:DUF3668 domain-containing protein n=1 Tax=Anopheles atroparvus TaxID=41427 RepID=A0AAG5CSH2_ANOAO
MERYQIHQKDDDQMVIFLRIFQGTNFLHEKPFRKIMLIASLDHNVLEMTSRRPVTAGTGAATFDGKLVWACDRYTAKRMKMENIPIKVECFEALAGGKRCQIGSVVIPLRSIPFVPLSRTNMIKPRWHRLIGIESERWRNRKPELNLLVMITDPQYLEMEDGKGSSTMEDSSGDDNLRAGQQRIIYANPTTDRLLGNAELLEDRGLLQIGSKDTDTDLFELSIFLNCGRHLNRLAPSADTFGLRYYLFGEVYPLRAERNKPGSAVFWLQGKIIMNIRSSLAALGDYLQDNLKIAVDLLPECDPMTVGLAPARVSPVCAIGKSTIDFVGFLKERNMDEFKLKYASKDYTLEAVRNFPIHPVDDGEQNGASNEQLLVPSLKCKISLRFLAKEETQSTEEKDIDEKQEQAPSSPTEVEELPPIIPDMKTEHEKQASSNLTEVRELPAIKTSTENEHEKELPLPLETLNNTEPSITKELRSLSQDLKKPVTPRLATPTATLEQVDIASILLHTDQDLRDIRRTFAFIVRVGLVKFTSSPSPGLWQLTLQHPKADTSFTKLNLELMPDAVHPERINFGDIALKLLFSTLPERVMEVIGSEPSKLTLNGPHGMHVLARLDNASLLVGTREQQPSGVVVMVDGSTGDNVAIATVGCSLEDVGLNYNSQVVGTDEKSSMVTFCCHTSTDSGAKQVRPFDENISYQLLEEQKAWMNEQREQFLEELKEKERAHLQSLTHEWKVHRAEEEKRLADRLAHADAMAAALDEARRTLENRDHQDARVVRLERQFREQLEAIQTKALRLEQEAEAQIEATRNQCRELQDQLAGLSADQQHLLDANLKLQRELDQERHLRQQEVSELQQTVENIGESKLRYKEEWAKMTRKVHQLEQELAVARTPYYQPQKREQRKTPSHRGEGSQMSLISARRRGAGDWSSCSFPKPPDSCQ